LPPCLRERFNTRANLLQICAFSTVAPLGGIHNANHL
jgi:hypothetical protein